MAEKTDSIKSMTLIEMITVIVIIGTIATAGGAKLIGMITHSEIKIEQDFFRNTLRCARQLAISYNCRVRVHLYRQAVALPSVPVGLYGGYKIIIEDNSVALRDDPETINGVNIGPTPGVISLTKNFNPSIPGAVIGEMSGGARRNVYLALQPGVLDVAPFVDQITFGSKGELIAPVGPFPGGVLTLVLQSLDNESAVVRIRQAGAKIN